MKPSVSYYVPFTCYMVASNVIIKKQHRIKPQSHLTEYFSDCSR